MKKTLSAVILTIVSVCVFAFGASAYENDYYYIDVPDDFTITEDGTGIMLEKGDDTTVVIECGDAEGLDFGTMSNSEQIQFDNDIKDIYTAEGTTIENFQSDYEAGEYGESAMNFTFEYEASGMILYYVEGLFLVEDDILYNIVAMYNDSSDYIELESVLGTFTTKTSGYITDGSDDYISDNEIADTIDFTSKSGSASFSLPGDFIEIAATSPIESQWSSYEGGFSVAYMETDNTSSDVLADLSESELAFFSETICESSGDAITDTVPSRFEVNGFKGVRVDGKFSMSGIEADISIFCFTTADKLISIYTYDYYGSNDGYAEDIMETLNIHGEILTKSSGLASGDSGILFIFIGIIAVLVIIIIVLIITNNNKKKRAAVQSAPYAAGYNPYGQPANQYGQPVNQYGQPVNNNYNQNINNNNF